MRSFLNKLFFVAPFTALATPVPVEVPNKPIDPHQRVKQVLARRQDLPEVLAFDGIDWEQTNNLTVCSVEQRNILQETAQSIYDWYGLEPLGADMAEDNPAWQRFFGGRIQNNIPQPHYTWFGDHDARSVAERQWLSTIDGTYQHIQKSMRAARDYPASGNSSPRKKNRRVAFLCQQAERIPGHCASQKGLSAYTTQNDATWPESGYGYTVTFCDNFFDKNRVFAKDLVKAEPTSTLSKLQTYEHILYHEYMHVHWFGHSKKIVDVADSVVPGETSGSLIYGATSTSQYARKYYGTNANSSVNPMVGINADNYAWYATNYIFRKAWGASKDPLKYLDTDDYTQLDNVKRRRSTDLQAQAEFINFLQHDHSSHDHTQLDKRQSADQTEAISDLFTWPRNCIWTLEEDDDMCIMVLDSYDDYVSEELGTTLSSQCQTIDPATPFSTLNAVHPDCKCTENTSGKDVKLYDIAKCRGFVGVVIGCRDGKDGGCDCRTNLNEGPHHVSEKDKGDRKCSALSRGGMTEEDIDDLIATGG